MSGDSKRVRLAARTTSALFSHSPVCGVFWGTEMGWSLPGGGGRGRDFVPAGRFARGRPRPVLRFCRRNIRRCPGVLYAHKARSANRVCSGGVQVVLSPRLHRLLPIGNSSLRLRVLEFGTRTQTVCVRFTDKPTRCRANWSGDEIAIARGGHTLRSPVHWRQKSALLSLFCRPQF